MHDNVGDRRVGSGMNSCSLGTMPMRPTLQSRLACSMRSPNSITNSPTRIAKIVLAACDQQMLRGFHRHAPKVVAAARGSPGAQILLRRRERDPQCLRGAAREVGIA